jgi:hypothetical protein
MNWDFIWTESTWSVIKYLPSKKRPTVLKFIIPRGVNVKSNAAVTLNAESHSVQTLVSMESDSMSTGSTRMTKVSETRITWDTKHSKAILSYLCWLD